MRKIKLLAALATAAVMAAFPNSFHRNSSHGTSLRWCSMSAIARQFAAIPRSEASASPTAEKEWYSARYIGNDAMVMTLLATIGVSVFPAA